ncbi:MAG: ATP-binding protein [Clostridia bacterium]|nr:ATP-binding protein [Clostridia bacterium]
MITVIIKNANEVNTISYSYEVRKKVRDAFEEKRKRAFAQAELHREEVHMNVPGVKEIDKALSETGLRVYAEALNKGSTIPLEKRIALLQEENAELQNARAQLLCDAGYDKDYTKVKFECEKCSDTGYVDLSACSCLLSALRRESYQSSGLGAMLTDQCFENFDLSIYPPDVMAHMTFVTETVKEFAEKFGTEDYPEKNLIFFGSTGLGKTHLSTALAKRLIDRGFYVVYDSIQTILHTFEKEKFSRMGDAVSTDKYFDCDFLIIDDLGSEFSNTFSTATLYGLINTRLNASKGTLISTNNKIEQLRKDYDERIVSRIVGGYRSLMFMGKDIRLSLRQNQKNNK